MEKRCADETEVSCEDCLNDGMTGARGEEKELIFDGCKAERDRDHIDHRIDRLVVFAATQHGDARREVFCYLFYSRPHSEESCCADEVLGDEFLYWNDDR